MTGRNLLAACMGLAVAVTACTSSGTPPARDPGKVVPVKHFAVPGHLYAVKGRRLYIFSGSSVKPVPGASGVKDPAVTLDGARLAYAQIQGQASTIGVGQSSGEGTERITSGSAPEGSLWAFAPAFSTDGRRIAYLTDRGKRPSSPQNLWPNDLGVWMYDIVTRESTRVVAPVDYTGGDSDPTFRPGTADQLVYTSYLYDGAPLQPVARLALMSTQTGRTSFLSPSLARNFQPSFSPDGKFLAFIRGGPEGDDLFATPLAASFAAEPHPYPTEAATLLQAGTVSQPVWAPDGNSIAFLMLVKGSFDLFVLPISTASGVRATGPAVAITQGSFFDADSRLAWGP
jgi:Tol biopolymer transport system component